MKRNRAMNSRALKRKMGMDPKGIFSAMQDILHEVDPEMAKNLKKETKIDGTTNIKDVLKKLKDTVVELENELMTKKPEKKNKVMFSTYSEKKTNTR